MNPDCEREHARVYRRGNRLSNGAPGRLGLDTVWLGALLFLLSGPGRANADGGWEGRILSFTWENDAIADTDRHYTHGAMLSYFSADDQLPRWLKKFSSRLPAIGIETKAQKFGLGAGQEIYTPENLSKPDLILDDRPYAGWLYARLALRRRGAGPRAVPVMETFRIDLGVIGPGSQAEAAQRLWHGVQPQGWDNQIHTELGAALRYDRRYLLAARSKNHSWGFDALPGFGGSAGNVDTHLGLGALVRFGYNIPNEFAAGQPPEPARFGAYLFTGVEGRWVVRNIFLDGNTFRSSHHVSKVALVGDWKVGATVVLKNIELTAAYTHRTREFEAQQSNDAFGTATVTFKF